jgi:Spy/CpxP family protein refolding chaperone
MKKMIFGLAALLMVTCTFAQPSANHHKGQHPGMERKSGMSYRNLNLTDAQKQQVKTINENFHQQMQTLNSKENITVKEQRIQKANLAKSHKEQLQAVLTPDQKQQLADQKAEMQKNRLAMEEKRLETLKSNLALTDAQVATIKSKQQSKHAKIEAIMKDDKIDQAEKKQQLITLRKEMKTELDKVLTPEQKTKLDTIRMEKREKMKSFRGHRMQHDAVK